MLFISLPNECLVAVAITEGNTWLLVNIGRFCHPIRISGGIVIFRESPCEFWSNSNYEKHRLKYIYDKNSRKDFHLGAMLKGARHGNHSIFFNPTSLQTAKTHYRVIATCFSVKRLHMKG